MKNNKPKQPVLRVPVKTTPGRRVQEEKPLAHFAIRHPLPWLAVAALIVYFPAFTMGFTDLDDAIFIRDFHGYNEQLGNFITSFHRGLFDAVKDPYYRPLFMDSMMLNYQLSGQNIMSYHVINVLLHITAVVLLYKLFIRLKVKELHAFILCLLFAVHPVLSQAVAWIPGRNDTLLAIFIFAFLITSVDYSNTGKPKQLLLSGFFLLLAFFTKETAAFAPPSAFILLVFFMGEKWTDKRNLTQYAVWAGCFILWFIARSSATIASSGIATTRALSDFVHRLPVVIQYLGKIFLPFNLSVFPTQEDTVYYYGIVAIVLLAVALLLSKQKNLRIVLGGLIIFLLFLMPALLVPASLNQQTFEHRLYLPIIGILLLLPQTIFFNNELTDKQLLTSGIVACGIFAIINFSHQRAFADPLSFWTQAVETSPNSAYANMMLAARLDKDEFERSCTLFRKAYRLNPHEKYLNFYLGEMLQKKDSVQASEPYLLAEKNTSGYYQCDFLLARVAMERKDFNGAITYLQTFLKKDPGNPMANNNLLLLFVNTQQLEKAKTQAKCMQQAGLEVPQQIRQKFNM